MNTRTKPSRRRAVAVWALAAAAVLAGVSAGAASAASSHTLAFGQMTGLVQSTGNLYWTTFSADEFGPDSATVWRGSKSNVPGSESVLYRETRSDRFGFGDLTYANPGTWFGYVLVNYGDLGRYRIKRVPLAGGTTVSLVQLPGFARDIDTDGTHLYWADSAGLRKMPLGGGAVTTLVGGSNITSIGLDASQVYYVTGSIVRSLPKAGGSSVLRAFASSTVTAMHIRVGFPTTVIDLGEQNGAVRSFAVGGASAVHQNPVAGRTVTSVSFDGARVLWTDCASPNGNLCGVRKRQNGTTTTVSWQGVGADFVQGDGGAMFWGDLGGLRKYVH